MEEDDSPWAGIDPTGLYRVTDPAQARIVADPVRSRFLHPFLGRERTVSEAAAELGCRTDVMLYRVRRMLAIDLLRITATRRRTGRPIKIYRSSHDGYFVPNEAMHYDDLRHRVSTQGAQLAEELIDAYTAVLFRGGNQGRVLARNHLDEVWSTDLAPATNGRGEPVLMTDIRVYLTADEAAQIRQVLTQAINSGRRMSSPRAGTERPTSRYLLNCSLLPISTTPR
ncbi:MAG: helix-turn-helix domain-containing protein [Microlunatus sp.]